nr:putative ribonuclease H-like domain-containing protein [Tanacetum cinerariifolium]
MSYVSEFEAINGGYVAFGGNPKGGKITGKGKIKTGKLDFDDVYSVKELKFNLFSVSQIANQDNSPRINKGTGYDNQRLGNAVGARETVGTTVVKKSVIQCYNCKEFSHVARECQKLKRAKDAAYHREKMLLWNSDHMNAILGVYTELDEDLKAQLHDKGIAISKLKKLIEKLKGKSMDTKLEKSSVIRQPNAFKSQRPSILGKPTIFSNSLK